MTMYGVFDLNSKKLIALYFYRENAYKHADEYNFLYVAAIPVEDMGVV